MNKLLERLKYHVTGAIERGEKQPIMAVTKPTIYQALKIKLGREPSNEELKNEVKRILCEALVERKVKRK